MLGVKVKKQAAENMRKLLVKRKKLDFTRAIDVVDEYVIFPITEPIDVHNGKIVTYQAKMRELRKSPYAQIRTLVNIPATLKQHLPDRWEKFGNVLVLRYPHVLERYKDEILKHYATVLRVQTILTPVGRIHGPTRKPELKIIFGTNTETVHVENGIKYKFDVQNIMFSSGNVNERVRMSTLKVDNEVIVDMFAGIGYFSLPIAKYQRPKMIYACELNALAYHYLLENIKLNNIHNIIPCLGDNRNFFKHHIADRVIMGYIDTEPFIPTALALLKNGTGIIHFHNTWTTDELKCRDVVLENYAKKYGYSYELQYFKVIKSYAPHIWHIVADMKIWQ